jgi:CHAD domain-containing protein
MQVTGSTPLWLAARTLLTLRSTDFFHHWQQVIAGFELEDIHDLRVSSRRFREGLALFAPAYPQNSTRKLSRRIKHVTGFLGHLRNTDEACLYFDRLSNELPEAARALFPLLNYLRMARQDEANKVSLALHGFNPKRLRKKVQSCIPMPCLFSGLLPDMDPFTPLLEFARAAFAERMALVMALVDDACQINAEEPQHRLRIAIKHLRYRMEILAPLLKVDYEAMHATVKKYQELLGKLHDLGVFEEILMGFPEIEKGHKDMLLQSMAAERQHLFDRFIRMTEQQPLSAIRAKLERVV